MGLLEKLWDDTVAGPRPDSGLGRLRKHNTFNFRSFAGKEVDGGNGRSNGEEAAIAAENAEGMRVTRSIMILKPPGNNQVSGSSPASPSDSTSPTSPFSGNRSGASRFPRRSSSNSHEKAANEDGVRSRPPQDV